MDRMEEGQRVGVLVNEFDKKGNRLPPKFFGRVDGEGLAADRKSGYVILEDRPEDAAGLPHGASVSSTRTHFHCSELVEAPEERKKPS